MSRVKAPPLHDRSAAAFILAVSFFLALVAGAHAADESPRLHGRISGPGGRPLAAVRVKIFVDGRQAASTWVDSTGEYSIRLPATSPSAIVLAWFLPVDDDLVAECVVIGDSSFAASSFLPCAPRVFPGADGAQLSLTLLDTDSRVAKLRHSPCFERSIQLPEQRVTP